MTYGAALLVEAQRFALSARMAVPPRKPRAALGLLASWLKARVSKAPALRGIDIVTSYTCNLKCAHCNISTMTRTDVPPLSVHEYEALERQFTELGVSQVNFTGGEPLIRADFAEIVRAFRPERRIMVLQTNSTLVRTVEKARWLRDIGIDIVNVSLDSGIAAEHDGNRGLKDQFEQTIRAIERSREAGLGVIVGTVVSHQNLESEGLARLFALSKEMRFSVILNLAVPTGRWQGNDSLMLTPEEQVHVRALVKANPYLRLDMDSTINRYGCPAFKEKLYITPYGDVTGCTFVQVTFGNVRETPLRKIRDFALASGFMSDYADRCYAAENPEFIERYIAKLEDDLPRPYDSFEKAPPEHDAGPHL